MFWTKHNDDPTKCEISSRLLVWLNTLWISRWQGCPLIMCNKLVCMVVLKQEVMHRMCPSFTFLNHVEDYLAERNQIIYNSGDFGWSVHNLIRIYASRNSEESDLLTQLLRKWKAKRKVINHVRGLQRKLTIVCFVPLPNNTHKS